MKLKLLAFHPPFVQEYLVQKRQLLTTLLLSIDRKRPNFSIRLTVQITMSPSLKSSNRRPNTLVVVIFGPSMLFRVISTRFDALSTLKILQFKQLSEVQYLKYIGLNKTTVCYKFLQMIIAYLSRREMWKFAKEHHRFPKEKENDSAVRFEVDAHLPVTSLPGGNFSEISWTNVSDKFDTRILASTWGARVTKHPLLVALFTNPYTERYKIKEIG